MNYFRCTVGGSGKGNTVTVTCAEEFAGLTITLAKTGKTYTKTCPSTSPYVVTFNGVENGTYTVSCTVDGQTYSETVIVQDISCVLNYGFNWKLWVDTASQLDSSDYASLSEVLADEEAIRELFLEHACVDYMAESTASNSDLETIINDDYCAKWINNSDYALDFLGANTVIKALMDTTDKYGYGEWTLMPQVPTMTSNTAPYGTVFFSSQFTNDGYYAWKAFDKSTSTRWAATGLTNEYIGYAFKSPVIINKASISVSYENNITRLKNYLIQASNDNSNWVTLYTGVIQNTGAAHTETAIFNNSTEYLYYRLYGIDNYTSTSGFNISIIELQFYAWAPKGNVPVMTSNTAPYGEVIYSSIYNNRYAWWAFNGVEKTSIESCWTTNNSLPGYIGYKFTNPIKANAIHWRTPYNSSFPNVPKTYKIQGSNDNSTWVDLTNELTTASAEDSDKTVTFDNENYYLYYRMYITETWRTSTGYAAVGTLQFYGRELSVSVPTMTSNTAPYGVASASTSTSARAPWKALEDATGSDDLWMTPSNTSTGWMQYIFNNPVCIKTVYIFPSHSSQVTRLKTFTILASNDNFATYDTILDSTTIPNTAGGTAKYTYSINNSNTYTGYRINVTASYSDVVGIVRLQFYGFDYSEKEFEVGTTRKWLYDHGLELESMSIAKTGGTVTKNSSHITVKRTDGSNICSLFTDNTIDLTNYDYLWSIGDMNVSASNVMAIATTATRTAGITGMTSTATVANLTCNTKYPLDVSSNTGSLYAGVYANTNGGAFDLKELWLE